MKIDRNTQIGGQQAKLVRDLLSDATNSDGFHADLVDEHLFRAWWRATIDPLIETGKLDRSHRGHALRLWTNARKRDKMFGVRLPKMPDFMAQTHSLIEALLAHELICEEGRENDGRIVSRVTDEGHATGMKSLVPRMSRAAAEALLEEVLARVTRMCANVRRFGSGASPWPDRLELHFLLLAQLRQTLLEHDLHLSDGLQHGNQPPACGRES
jgi:hypothetical protein